MSRLWPFRRRRRKQQRDSTWLEQRRRRRRIIYRVAIVAAILVVLVVALQTFMRLYVDWLWFGEVGLRAVFWRRVWFGLVLGAAFAGVFFAVVFGSIEIARRSAPKHQVFEGIADMEYVRADAVHWIRRFGLLLTALVAIAVGFAGAGAWLTFIRAFNRVPFGVEDPIFGHDISFYVFTLPAWQFVYTFLYATLFVGLGAAVLVHLILQGIEIQFRVVEYRATPEQAAEHGIDVGTVIHRAWRPKGMTVRPPAVAQLSALLGALFVLGGLGYLLKAWNLLLSPDGVVFGAGYADVHLRLPIIRALMVVAVGLGAWMIYNAVRSRRPRWLLYAAGGWIAAVIVFLGIVPAAFQALIVNPNQLDKELEYITYDLNATRAAYDLTAITRQPYALEGDLSASALALNSATIDNIRRWDPETLQRSYKQLQQLRPYYAFTTVSVDRYRIGGRYVQTMLSPRELNLAGLPAQGQTWVNEHITYTHGYGVALSAVNQVARDGSPDFLVKDVPVTSDAPILDIRQPRIYYGLLGNEYVLVRTTNREFDYPGKGGDVYRSYEGNGGIPISSLLNRIAFCVRYDTLKFLTTTVITDESRVIMLNNIKDRLAMAAPFLTFDSSPYMVIANGRLYWIADAYTTSNRVPYSQPISGINYVRNSVKVVIDAYNGSMDFYLFDERDPLIRAYEKMFPGMFKPADEMDPALRRHVRYPQGFFAVQAEMFATYHVTEPDVLYNKGDQWQIPTNVSITGAGQMNPYYMIMRLPGETREEFVLILPFTPNLRSNMIGWLGAQSDPPNYGKAVNFQFPANMNVYGPAQVEAAVNQDPAISAQRTLWGQTGSRVIFGNLIIVPIEDSLLYVQPLYLESEQTQLPQVQRMIVFYRSPSTNPDIPTGQQQNVVMARTLDAALARIFGAPTGARPPSSGGGAVNEEFRRLAERANAQYDAAQAALRAGNLEEFARQIDALGRTLDQLAKQR